MAGKIEESSTTLMKNSKAESDVLKVEMSMDSRRVILGLIVSDEQCLGHIWGYRTNFGLKPAPFES